MNPLSLHARNYRCFDELDLQLPDGCVAILGQNGAGKSSIVNAIDVALFGARSLADLLCDTADGGELLLEVELEHAGELYRIRRGYSARGRGKTTLDFERNDGDIEGAEVLGGWVPLTRASAKETQELIEQTLGLSRETFRASAFLAQGDGAAFTDAQPRDRKRILAQVLGLDRYDRLQERARQDRRTIEAEIATLDGRTQAARELAATGLAVAVEVSAASEAIVELLDEVADLERDHEALAERYQAAREQAARRQAAEAELREAEAQYARLNEIGRRGGELSNVIAAAREQLALLGEPVDLAELERREQLLVETLQSHQQAKLEHDALVREHARLTSEREAIVARVLERDEAATVIATQIGEIEDGALDHCPTCAQLLGTDARAATIESLTKQSIAAIDEANALRRQAEAIVIPTVPDPPAPPTAHVTATATGTEADLPVETVLAGVRTAITREREASTQRATLDERIRTAHAELDTQPTNLQNLKVEASAAVEAKKVAVDAIALVDVTEITTKGGLVKQRLDTARATLEQQRTLKARLDERLAQIAAAEKQLEESKSIAENLKSQADVVAALERAFGPSGIPTLIVENSAIPYLETEANRILDELGTSYRVELRTQAELKSGDGLRDTLDVIVQTEHGERAYETFSGGERTRINLGLRIALARLLAHRRGAESRLLVVDEPDGLDATGMAALVDVLRGLEGDFAKLYIVSHVPALRDSFDTSLLVRDGMVVEDGVFEAAIA